MRNLLADFEAKNIKFKKSIPCISGGQYRIFPLKNTVHFSHKLLSLKMAFLAKRKLLEIESIFM